MVDFFLRWVEELVVVFSHIPISILSYIFQNILNLSDLISNCLSISLFIAMNFLPFNGLSSPHPPQARQVRGDERARAGGAERDGAGRGALRLQGGGQHRVLLQHHRGRPPLRRPRTLQRLPEGG